MVERKTNHSIDCGLRKGKSKMEDITSDP
jgi:hypothetical protein